jgi:hypothetical protein
MKTTMSDTMKKVQSMFSSSISRLLIFATVLTLRLCIVAGEAVGFDFNTVMVSARPSGDALGPQLGPGIDVASFGGFSVNSAGQVAFRADVSGPGIVTTAGLENDTAIWRWIGGSNSLLLREDSQAPGLAAGVLVSNLSSPVFVANGTELSNDGSQLAFLDLKGAGVTTGIDDRAMFRLVASGVGTKVYRKSDTAPGIPTGLMITDLRMQFMPTSDSSGNVMFRVQPIQGPGLDSSNDDAIMFGPNGSYSVLVREGQQISGLTSGIVLASGGVAQARIAFSGNYAAIAPSLNDLNNPGNFAAVLIGQSGSFQLAVRQGDPLPGGGTYSNQLRNIRVNNSGQVLFIDNNANLVFGSIPNGFQVLAKTGTTAPGTAETFGAFTIDSNGPRRTQITQSGLAAFQNSTTPSGNAGVWVFNGSTVALAIGQGQAAGDLAGVAVGSLQEWCFNNSGNLVIETALTGSEVNASNDSALWLVDSLAGKMTLLLREGDLFDVDPSANIDQRTIASFALGGIGDGTGQNSMTGGLSDNGWLAVNLGFTNASTGIFVTQVPEPSALILMGLGLTTVTIQLIRGRSRTATQSNL